MRYLVRKAGQPVEWLIIGEHHVCESCGHRWRDAEWPAGCPGCGESCAWVISLHTAEEADAHVPLRKAEAMAEAHR